MVQFTQFVFFIFVFTLCLFALIFDYYDFCQSFSFWIQNNISFIINWTVCDHSAGSPNTTLTNWAKDNNNKGRETKEKKNTSLWLIQSENTHDRLWFRTEWQLKFVFVVCYYDSGGCYYLKMNFNVCLCTTKYTCFLILLCVFFLDFLIRNQLSAHVFCKTNMYCGYWNRSYQCIEFHSIQPYVSFQMRHKLIFSSVFVQTAVVFFFSIIRFKDSILSANQNTDLFMSK